MNTPTRRQLAVFAVGGGIIILWMAGIIWYVQSARKSPIPYTDLQHYRDRIRHDPWRSRTGGYNPFARGYVPEGWKDVPDRWHSKPGQYELAYPVDNRPSNSRR